MAEHPDHQATIVSFKRIEGQVRGIQKMVEARKYCVDILNQIQAVKAALARVEKDILQKHVEHCVVNAVRGKSAAQKDKKLEEIFQLIRKM